MAGEDAPAPSALPVDPGPRAAYRDAPSRTAEKAPPHATCVAASPSGMAKGVGTTRSAVRPLVAQLSQEKNCGARVARLKLKRVPFRSSTLPVSSTAPSSSSSPVWPLQGMQRQCSVRCGGLGRHLGDRAGLGHRRSERTSRRTLPRPLRSRPASEQAPSHRFPLQSHFPARRGNWSPWRPPLPQSTASPDSRALCLQCTPRTKISAQSWHTAASSRPRSGSEEHGAPSGPGHWGHLLRTLHAAMAEAPAPRGRSGGMQTVALRLHPGEEVKSALMAEVQAQGLDAAFVATCVGSVRRATLRMAHATAETRNEVRFARDRRISALRWAGGERVGALLTLDCPAGRSSNWRGLSKWCPSSAPLKLGVRRATYTYRSRTQRAQSWAATLSAQWRCSPPLKWCWACARRSTLSGTTTKPQDSRSSTSSRDDGRETPIALAPPSRSPGVAGRGSPLDCSPGSNGAERPRLKQKPDTSPINFTSQPPPLAHTALRHWAGAGSSRLARSSVNIRAVEL